MIIRDATDRRRRLRRRADIYHRDGDRKAPSNLYTTTEELFSFAAARGRAAAPAVPVPGARREATPAGATPVAHVYVSFGGGAGQRAGRLVLGLHRRAAGCGPEGNAHVDETGQQVAPENVVIQFCDYHDTGYVDTTGSTVYEADLVGEGDVWVFTNGVLVVGRWSKASTEAVTQYTDLAGAPITADARPDLGSTAVAGPR